MSPKMTARTKKTRVGRRQMGKVLSSELLSRQKVNPMRLLITRPQYPTPSFRLLSFGSSQMFSPEIQMMCGMTSACDSEKYMRSSCLVEDNMCCRTLLQSIGHASIAQSRCSPITPLLWSASRHHYCGPLPAFFFFDRPGITIALAHLWPPHTRQHRSRIATMALL